MGLFKGVRRVVRSVGRVGKRGVQLGGALLAATSNGVTGGAIARLRPKTLGIKSATARSLVRVSQDTMLAVGAAKLGGSKLPTLSAPTQPVKPAAAAPQSSQLDALLWFYLLALFSGRR